MHAVSFLTILRGHQGLGWVGFSEVSQVGNVHRPDAQIPNLQ